MSNPIHLPLVDLTNRTTVSDIVFNELHRQVLSLELEPGAKISEVEVAKLMGVSRQPVRDAFYRLSKLGFLLIRPQRATTVTLISGKAVMRARFIRTALELETVRKATEVLTTSDITALEKLLEEQDIVSKAGDKAAFHKLDDQFHFEICSRAGLEFTWELIAENKGHMDRVRMLSLAFASRDTWHDHLRVLEAIKSRNPDEAAREMRAHLSRIKEQIDRIRADNHAWFADEDEV